MGGFLILLAGVLGSLLLGGLITAITQSVFIGIAALIVGVVLTLVFFDKRDERLYEKRRREEYDESHG